MEVHPQSYTRPKIPAGAAQASRAQGEIERHRESITRFQPQRADAGAARTSPGRSQSARKQKLLIVKNGCSIRTTQACPKSHVLCISRARDKEQSIAQRNCATEAHLGSLCLGINRNRLDKYDSAAPAQGAAHVHAPLPSSDSQRERHRDYYIFSATPG